MFEKIKQRFTKKKKRYYYKHQFLYIGSTTKEHTHNGVQLTYSHYDVFVGNHTYLPNVTKLKRITGEQPNSTNKYNYTHDNTPATLVDKHTKDVYVIHSNITEWIYKNMDLDNPDVFTNKTIKPSLPDTKLNRIMHYENQKNIQMAYFNHQLRQNKLNQQSQTNQNNDHEHVQVHSK